MQDEDEPVEMPIDGVLDLHTFRPREVPDLVGDYLDACRARGITAVRIVHGKGTGTLQRTVHALLGRRADVVDFALAPADRGGWGATLVTLRAATARIVTPSEWSAAPWRNGGGITHEIAREGPPEAFAWRVSVADVAQAGPFSLFPGVDRVIGLLEGDGFSLASDRPLATLRRPGELFAFPGDVAVTCTLLGGPVRDLNVMVDRRRWRVACERTVLAGTHALPATPLVFAFVLAGTADVTGLGRIDRHALVVSERDLHLVAPQPIDLVVARLSRP